MAPSRFNNMMLIDFPGLNANKELYDHIQVQMSALKVIPFRMICFVSKGGDRKYDEIMNDISQMADIFDKQRDNVVVLITNSENYTATIKAEIEHSIKECAGISNIIFTKKEDSCELLSQNLNKYLCKMKNQKEFMITSLNFYNQMRFSVFNQAIKKIREDYKQTFFSVLKSHEECYDASTEQRELIRCLYFSIKRYLNQQVKSFRKEIGKVVGEENVDRIATEQIIFQNEVFIPFNDFRDKCQKKLEIQSHSYSGNGNDYNRFKECHFCKTIWFRVYGCDSIICGRRSIGKDKIFGRFAHYNIEIKENALKISKNEINNEGSYQEKEFVGLTPEELDENKKILANPKMKKVQIQTKGCGKTVKWSDMNDVTVMVMKELQVIENSDYYAEVEESKIAKEVKEISKQIENL